MKNLEIIDTFRIDGQEIFLEAYHVDRTQRALNFYNPQAPRDFVKARYQKVPRGNRIMKGRAQFDPLNFADMTIEVSPLDNLQPITNLTWAKQAQSIYATPFKTNQRDFWDEQIKLKPREADDVIAFNTRGEITETSRFNVFFHDDHHLITPPLDSGCLDGCLRQFLKQTKFATWQNRKLTLIETRLKLADIKGLNVLVGNSLRGLRSAKILTTV